MLRHQRDAHHRHHHAGEDRSSGGSSHLGDIHGDERQDLRIDVDNVDAVPQQNPGHKPELEPEPESGAQIHLGDFGLPISPTAVSVPPSAAKSIAIDKLRRELFKLSQKHWRHMGWDDIVPALEQGFTEERLVGVGAALRESRHIPLEQLWEELRNANDKPLAPAEINKGMVVQHIGDRKHPGPDNCGYGIGIVLGKPDKKHRVWVDFSKVGGPPAVMLPCGVEKRRDKSTKRSAFDAEASLKRPGPPGLKMSIAVLKAKTERLLRHRGVLWEDAVEAIKDISNADLLQLVVAEMEEPEAFVTRLFGGIQIGKVKSSIIPGSRIRTDRGELDQNQISVVVENRAPIHSLPSRDSTLLKPGRLQEYLEVTFGRKDGTPGLFGPNSASRKIYEEFTVQRSTAFLKYHNLDEVDGTGHLIYGIQSKVTLNLCGMGIARERLAAGTSHLQQTMRELGCECTPSCSSDAWKRGGKHENKDRPESTYKMIVAREQEVKYWEAALRLTKYGWAMDDMNIRLFAPLLTFIPNLGCVRLCDNKIADRAMEALCQRLPFCVEELTGCSGLVTLELQGNHIGDDGIEHLARAVPSLVELQELYLQNNRFRGIAPLADVLPNCPQLKELQLGGNRIDCEGAEALAKVLHLCCNRKPGLSVIGLSGNRIDENGARALACVLPACKRLRKVMIQMNQFRQAEGEFNNAVIPVSAVVRVNDSRQLVIQSKRKGKASVVQACRVNSSGERAQRLLGIGIAPGEQGAAKVVPGDGPPETGDPGELIGGSFEPWDFGGGSEEELHLVLDTPAERQLSEPRTDHGDNNYAKRLANHTRTVKFFVNVAFVDVAETVLSAYLYVDGRTALEALKPGWLSLELDPRRPERVD